MDSVLWFLLGILPWWLIAIAAVVAAWSIHRLFGWRAALGAIAVGLVALFTKRTYERGKADTLSSIDDRTDDLRESFDEIDQKHTDPSDAYEHLRGLQPNRRD